MMMIIIKTPDHKLLISPHYLQIKIQIAQAAFQIRSLFQSHFPLALNTIPSFRFCPFPWPSLVSFLGS